MTTPISSKAGALAVWVVAYIFFLFSLANNFSASHDSINYLNHITKGEHLFHQHHLLYHFLANKWLQLFGPLFASVPQHYIVESFTAFWGSGTLAVCYLFFSNRFYLGRLVSVLGIAVIAFSYGTWFYSVNVEVYAPPLFFLLTALYVITKKSPQKNDIWLIAVLHSLAILFHQVNVLFGFVVLQWIYINRKNAPAGLSFLKYFTTGLVIVGSAYFFIGWYVEGKDTLAAFTDWMLGYSVGHDYWRPLSISTPLQVLAGFSRAFIGAHFIFQVPVVNEFLESSFSYHSLRDEIFLAGQLPAAMAWLLCVLAAVLGILLVWLSIRFIRKFRSMQLHFHVLNPLLLCLLVYSLFFTFWMPEILEFWILQMVIVWILVIGMLPLIRFPFHLSAKSGLLVMVLLLFTINYFGSMRWLQRLKYDWYYVEVKKLPDLQRGDVVIVEHEWILKDYVRYYTPAMVIATDEPDFNAAVTTMIVQETISANGKVYLYRNEPGGKKNGWQLIRAY